MPVFKISVRRATDKGAGPPHDVFPTSHLFWLHTAQCAKRHTRGLPGRKVAACGAWKAPFAVHEAEQAPAGFLDGRLTARLDREQWHDS